MRPPGLRPAPRRLLQPGHGAGPPGAAGAAARAPRRGRHPRPPAGDGPHPGPGPGTGSQDDPPQDRRVRRRRQGSGPADGHRAAPRGGQPARPRVPLHRRAHQGVLRHAGDTEDARGPAEVPRPRHRGDLGHRRRRDRCWSSWPSRPPRWPRRSRSCCPACAPSPDQIQAHAVLRPGRMVPDLFAEIIDAGFDLLTYRKASAGEGIPDLPADAFTTAAHAGDDGREHRYELADGTAGIIVTSGTHKGRVLTLRQVTRLDKGRQIRILTTRQASSMPPAAAVYGMGSRWREENYFRYRRAAFRPRRPGHLRRHRRGPGPQGPQPGQEESSRRRQDREEGPGRRPGHPRRQANQNAHPSPRPGNPHHQPAARQARRPGRRSPPAAYSDDSDRSVRCFRSGWVGGRVAADAGCPGPRLLTSFWFWS